MIQFNKKGVESFPFFLFLTVLIAAFVIAIGFYQIQTFSDFTAKKELTESYQSIIKAMEDLRSTTDQGSFTRINLKIPLNSEITISTNNTITIHFDNQTIKNDLSNEFNITNIYIFDLEDEVELKAGDYEIVIYHGKYAPGNEEAYTIYFI